MFFKVKTVGEGSIRNNMKEEIKKFIESNIWKEAKSYAKSFPHEYIVKDYLDDYNKNIFEEFVILTREKGVRERFFRTFLYLFLLDGYKYWTMGSPINETIILNRIKL